LNICTVICRNYRAQARVLAESFAAHSPDGDCVVLILDERRGATTSLLDEPYRTIWLEDLGSPCIEEMAGIYTALEFSTAVKPWLLAWMLDTYGADGPVAYFDPDIAIVSTMPELKSDLREAAIVLTPHLTAPNPLDGLNPTEQHLLLAGTYNLGFIALSEHPEARRMLEWWKERLRWDCIVDPSAGFFVDQRFVDFVPGLFEDVKILRHPGYNIAYWNMATRCLTPLGPSAEWDGGEPRFLHFSGFDPRQRNVVSRHQNRLDLAAAPGLASVFADYADRLLGHGYASFSSIPYGLAAMCSGAAVTAPVRLAYRCFLRDGGEGSLFSREGEERLRAYLRSADPAQPDLSRAECLAIAERPHLFGCVDEGASNEVLREQIRCSAAVSELFGSLVEEPFGAPDVRPEQRSNQSPGSIDLGINVLGYLDSTVGVGEVARRLIGALDELRAPVWPIALPMEITGKRVPFLSPARSDGLPFGHTLVCVNADALPKVASDFAGADFRGRFVSGVWWWELDVFPSHFHEAFRFVDQVLVGSTFIAEGLRRVAPVPVHHVPIPIWMDYAMQPNRQVFGERAAGADFIFYFSFDYFSVFRRKNPLGLVEAFTRAFAELDGAHLVIKSINHEHFPEEQAMLARATAGRGDITLIERFVSVEDRDGMTGSCDCYVSLHRSEGLGMTMAEAMYAGKPVIATGYSGNRDFMNDDNSYLIAYELAPVGPGTSPYPEDALWAEPDIDQAARRMREVFEDRVASTDLGNRAAASIRETNSITATADALKAIFA
jgi:glycosyltransferase involved in cell wall biosynthesis